MTNTPSKRRLVLAGAIAVAVLLSCCCSSSLALLFTGHVPKPGNTPPDAIADVYERHEVTFRNIGGLERCTTDGMRIGHVMAMEVPELIRVEVVCPSHRRVYVRGPNDLPPCRATTDYLATADGVPETSPWYPNRTYFGDYESNPAELNTVSWSDLGDGAYCVEVATNEGTIFLRVHD